MNIPVKYHNDFNKIKLSKLTELEQNLLFGIIAKVKEKKSGTLTSIYSQDLKNLAGKNLTNRELTDFLFSLKEKFFKADFTILIKDEERKLIGNATINLFQEMVLWFNKENVSIYNMDFECDFSHIDLMLNPRFEYILNDLFQNFTRFELAEFIALSGKYTKTLYRLLKQYRQTGQMQMEWGEFLYVMDIPLSYEQKHINAYILKPAIKELTKQRNLFDTKRVPFKNLQYEKIKEKGFGGRGQGGKVVGIKFTFISETKEIEAKLEKENPKNNIDIEKLKKLYKGRNYCDSRGKNKIIDLNKKGDGIYASFRDEAGYIWGKDFTSIEELESTLD